MKLITISSLSFTFIVSVHAFSFSENGITINYAVTKWSSCLATEEEYDHLKIIERISIQHCVFECSIRPVCKSLDYLRPFKVCKLYGAESGRLQKGQCTHIGRSDIHLQDQTCNCSSGRVCKIGANACDYEECSPIDLNYETVLGNVFDIGGKLQVKCSYNTSTWTEFNSTECSKEGNWSILPKCKSKIYYFSSVLDYHQHDLREVNIEGKTEVVFETKGWHDAHLLLQKAQNDYNQNVVEIVLGGWGNTNSVIRKSPQGQAQTTYQIGLGGHPNHDTFMSWCELTHDITAMRVSYGFGSDGYFIFH